MVGDASEVGVGGFLPDGELGIASSSFRVPFTEQQLARRAANDFSSTEREVVATTVCLQFVDAQRPELLAGRIVQYQTDSQAAMPRHEGNTALPEGRGRVAHMVRRARL